MDSLQAWRTEYRLLRAARQRRLGVLNYTDINECADRADAYVERARSEWIGWHQRQLTVLLGSY